MFSNSTSSVIKTLVAQKVFDEEALTTAFFCEFMSRWFDILNCRILANALYQQSNEKMDFLKEVSHWSGFLFVEPSPMVLELRLT